MADVEKTIGTTGRDYSTITAWEADINNTTYSVAGTKAVGVCYADSDFTESDTQVTIDASATNVTAIKLTAEASERHTGVADTGVRILRGTGTGSLIEVQTATITEIEWLELDGGANDIVQGILRKNQSGATHYRFANCLVHNQTGSSAFAVGIDLTGDCDVHNCIIYSIHTNQSSSRFCYGIDVTTARDVWAQNCTIHDITSDNASNTANCHGIIHGDRADTKVQNCVVTDVTHAGSGTVACYAVTSPGSATIDHNLASDTSADGTGSLDSKTSANQYVLTTPGIEDLHLKSGADAIDAGDELGSTPTGVNIDIDGIDRTVIDNWDMGAHDFIAAGGTDMLNRFGSMAGGISGGRHSTPMTGGMRG